MLEQQLIDEFNKETVNIDKLEKLQGKKKPSIVYQQLIQKYGSPYKVAKNLLSTQKPPQQWVTDIWLLGKGEGDGTKYLDCTLEYVAVNSKYVSIFSKEEINSAKRRLKNLGLDIDKVYSAHNQTTTLNTDEKQEIAIIESGLPDAQTKSEQFVREQIVKVRLQQSEFRKRILKKYNSKCVITGIVESEVLIASHIKPWSKSEDSDKLDVENGLLLSATYDKLFDRGYISFENDGKILVSKNLSAADVKILQIKAGEVYDIRANDRMKEYLDYHRKEIFEKHSIN